MTMINKNVGTVKAIRNKKVVVELPRGGTFTFKSDREFKIGEAVCFTVNSVLNKITEVMPKKEADETVRIGQDESASGVFIEDYEGIDLEEDDSGFAEDDLSYLDDEEDITDAYDITDQGQRAQGNFDFECGESGNQIVEAGDYFADSDSMEEPDGAKD